jgi:hypothetical protein
VLLCRIAVVVLCTAALAGCSPGIDDSEPTPEEFLAEEPYAEPPAVTLAPTPDQAGIPVVGCPTAGDVKDALTDAGTLERGSGMDVDRPTCAGDWSAATITAADVDPLRVVLQTRGGRLYVVVAGTGVCDDPAVAGAPAQVRAAAGC